MLLLSQITHLRMRTFIMLSSWLDSTSLDLGPKQNYGRRSMMASTGGAPTYIYTPLQSLLTVARA